MLKQVPTYLYHPALISSLNKSCFYLLYY
ncbi:hypothetical protein F383_36354 [Gossypium arboreum]|uniref:Uncharacterized protein n=1 Tax=Gossypium arboreum TaxID=29729 RepID=A0A0B0NDE0_GOSAR|nr:hypothetical protein F383_36354 [Gossypium arboreum]